MMTPAKTYGGWAPCNYWLGERTGTGIITPTLDRRALALSGTRLIWDGISYGPWKNLVWLPAFVVLELYNWAYFVEVTMRRVVCLLLLSTCVFAQVKPAATPAATAKPTTVKTEIIDELNAIEKKFVSLAEAVPQEKYTWRPAEG